MAAWIILVIISVDIFSYSHATECGGFLTATTSVQNITSPNYPEEYPNNVTCKWIIAQSDPDLDIRIVININLEMAYNAPKCRYDSLQIFNGSEDSLHQLEDLCGIKNKTIQTTGDSNITVILTTDEPNPCQTVVVSSKTVESVYSDNHPLRYKSNTTCTWLFMKQGSYKHHVLRLYEHQPANWNCNEQYVEIYNGVSERERLLGKYCGNGDPIFIGSDSLFVKLVTGAYPIGRGLQIEHFLTNNWVSTHIELSRNPVEFGATTSPNYPYLLPSNLDYCTIITYLYTGYVINVNFITSDIGKRYYCVNKISVYNGKYIYSSQKLGSFCGQQYNRSFTSRESSILIHMTTGSDPEGNGFNMTYQVMKRITTSPTTSTQRPEICGTTRLTAYYSWRYLTSPGYPHTYGEFINCKWTIATQRYSSMVRIVVFESELGFSNDCDYTSVTAYDGGDTFSPILRVWCGSTKPTVQSSQHKMTLRFRTDADSQIRGFRLQFSQVSDPPSCGGTLQATSESKELTSPGYPFLYAPNLSCKWTILTSDSYIRISVLESNLEWSGPCTDDFVTVYDGRTTSANFALGTFCSHDTPTYYSTVDTVTILFNTDGSSNHKGFKLTYEKIYNRVPSTSSSSKTNIGGLVGGVVTGVVVLVVVIAVAVSYSVRKARNTRGAAATTTAAYPQIINPTNNIASAPDISYSGSTYQSPGNFQYQPQMNAYNNPAYSNISTENLYDKYGPPPAYNTLNFETPSATVAGVMTQGTGVGIHGVDVRSQGAGAGARTQVAEVGTSQPVSNHL